MKTEAAREMEENSVVTERKKKSILKKRGVGQQCAVRKVKQEEDSLCAMEVTGDLTKAV